MEEAVKNYQLATDHRLEAIHCLMNSMYCGTGIALKSAFEVASESTSYFSRECSRGR